MHKNNVYKDAWVGDVAAILGIIALIPLAWHVTATEHTHSLNYMWLGIKLVAAGLWFYFGYVNRITPNVISSVAIGALVIYLIGIKIYIENIKHK
jgi:uncharacterized protein with PQ loop repeat